MPASPRSGGGNSRNNNINRAGGRPNDRGPQRGFGNNNAVNSKKGGQKPKPALPPKNQAPTAQAPAESNAEAEKPKERPKLIELPMAEGGADVPEAQIDGMVYIAYGEQGDDVAFELSEDLEESLDILEQMAEDGFKVKLFQAHEIEIMRE